MGINLKQLIQKNMQEDNSATLLLATKKLEQQIEIAEKLTREILKLPLKKSPRANPDCFGVWPEDVEGKTIKIDQVHEFIRQTQLKPFRSKFKVGVIISAEKLTAEAQNALLKTLEEPSKNTFLILTTGQVKRLLPTILSRCQVLEFEKQDEGLVNEEAASRLLESDIVERFSFVEKMLKQKDKSKVNEDIEILLANLLNHLRASLVKNNKTNSKEIIDQINLIEETLLAIEKNVNKRLALESLMINLL
jgi:DNA polymerase-3 subunit delta'